MELAHIEFDKLSVSNANMRQGKRCPDVADILPSIRARGILVPLLVRPGDEADHFEIIAGRRRYFSAKAIKDEGGAVNALPCAIMEPGDDAAALEASLLENIARLDPDPMTQYETIVQLLRKGRRVGEVAATFGLTETQVKQRLALGNLLPKIREAYRAEEIDAETVRYLTLASKTQQKDWLALLSEETQYAPTGLELKNWLFGGRSISTKAALFPLADYPGEIIADLFGDDGYFADADLFWAHQDAAIEVKRQSYLAAGWKAVDVMVRGEIFHTWEHEKAQKRRGGKVIIAVSNRGEVECHEGYLSRKDAAKQRRSQDVEAESAAPKAQRPEVTSNLQAYIDLHRHAAVRATLIGQPDVAFRLLLAHLITGSAPWQRRFEPALHQDNRITASVAASSAEQRFEACRAGILKILGEPEDAGAVLRHHGDHDEIVVICQQLLTLPHDDVMRIAAIVMAEALQPGTVIVEMLGALFQVEMEAVWQPDDSFFELIRDREVLNSMLTEVAGPETAAMHLTDTAKRQKAIIRSYLAGNNGRPKVGNWLPGWLSFPASHYTERGGLAAVKHQSRLTELLSKIDGESDTNNHAKA